MFRTLYDEIVPAINNHNNHAAGDGLLRMDANNDDDDDGNDTPTTKKLITIKLHHVIQPWHPQSTMVHEAALAVKRVVPGLYLTFIRNVYKKFMTQHHFTDHDTWNKTRLEIYDDLLCECLPSSDWIDDEQRQQVQQLLYPPRTTTGRPPRSGTATFNSGNAITAELKFACRYHRQRGVHITPTVFANGIEASEVSSGWKADDWNEFFKQFWIDRKYLLVLF